MALIRDQTMTLRRSKRYCAKVEPDIYEHYKGGLYEVLHLAHHTETEEELVVYRSLRDGRIWIRPLSMFCDEVVLLGGKYPRFARLSRPSLISFAGVEHRAA